MEQRIWQITAAWERELVSNGKTETSETSDKGNGAKGEIEDIGECSGELGEMTSQSDVDGVGQFEEGGGRVGQDAIVCSESLQ